ncbi:hypothetical protein [Amycolatopsis sp. cmx-11-12]|uniref:hypothetical protein n=1 Tax=Amycolatopsis sp. cmx-11-12 TaxID=2785795 RepID=UPI003917D261
MTDVLASTQAVLGPALREAVDLLPDPIRRVASYHVGWRDEQGRPTRSGGSKMIRPAVTLVSAQAVGGVDAEAVPAAVAVELVHNFRCCTTM